MGSETLKKIIIQRGTKDYTSWVPSITTEADYPAASCCDMFYTEGTQQGDWYLPACGELGYIMPPFNKINQAITNILNVYGSSVGVELGTRGDYWSSTEHSSDYARYVYTGSGGVYGSSKNDYYCVRAFLKVSEEGKTSTVSLSCNHCTFEDGSTGKTETVQTNSHYTLPTVIPDERYRFYKWSKDGLSVSTQQNAQVFIETDCYLQANCYAVQPPAPDPTE